MSSGLEIYRKLRKKSKRSLNSFEEAHSKCRERFHSYLNDMISTLSRLEQDYDNAKLRAIEQRPNSIEKAVAEALEAKLIRYELLALRSSMALLRANEFYHNAMVTMARDARLGIEYDESKVNSLLPEELREPIIEAMKGLDMSGMLEPLVDELDGPPLPVIPHRFTLESMNALNDIIEDAGGVEVFVVGTLNSHGMIDDLEVVCRGNASTVPAAVTRVERGQVVIHNHPSGVMEASEADMQLAHIYKERGIGVAIVDNDVSKVLWVVEPNEEVVG